MTAPTIFARLLIVDDEVAHMNALCDTLGDAGYSTTGFASASQALRAIQEQEFDLLLTDLMMPEMDGIALLKAAQEIDRNLVVVVMTGHGAVDSAVEAMKAGALDYIQKPFRISKIQPVLSRALMVRRLRTENIQLREAVTLHELTTAFTRELDWQTAAAQVADTVMLQAGGAASVLTIAEDGDTLRVAAVRGADSEQLADRSFAVDADLLSWVAAMRELVAGPGLWSESSFAPPSALRSFNVGVSMPMFAGGEFVGIVNARWPEARRGPTIGQLKTLCGIASAAANALEAALLVDQLHRANQHLEGSVRERTRQLEAANEDLEAFSYSISHDLRAPLRIIDGYAGAMLDDGEPHSAQTKQSIDAIRAGARRMMALIEDLLTLAQLGQQPLEKRLVKMGALARLVAVEVTRDSGARVDLKVETLPDCMGDESLLKQVLVNLISNAVKFTSKSHEPKIRVDARYEPGEIVYIVRDNGAGFDMEHAAKLFGVFQRLHSAKDFEGTGIGLSIVQRVIARHGGRAWAEGTVGKGATFYFSLPN
jgi:signal transduction histidine kinase